MFYLYGNIAGWSQLDVSKDEIDILNTMERYRKDNARTDFIVLDKKPDMDDISTTISKEQDFTEYKHKVMVKRKI